MKKKKLKWKKWKKKSDDDTQMTHTEGGHWLAIICCTNRFSYGDICWMPKHNATARYVKPLISWVSAHKAEGITFHVSAKVAILHNYSVILTGNRQRYGFFGPMRVHCLRKLESPQVFHLAYFVSCRCITSADSIRVAALPAYYDNELSADVYYK